MKLVVLSYENYSYFNFFCVVVMFVGDYSRYMYM